MFLSNTYTRPLSVKFENPAVTKKIFHGFSDPRVFGIKDILHFLFSLSVTELRDITS